MNKKTNKSVTSQSGQVWKGIRKGDMMARGWEGETGGRVGGKAFWGGDVWTEVWMQRCQPLKELQYTWHNNQQVPRTWCNEEGDMLDSPGNLLISFQNSCHLYLLFHRSKNHHPLHHSERRSTTLRLYAFSNCPVHTELHTVADKHAFLTELWTPEVSSGRARIASSFSRAQSWHMESTWFYFSRLFFAKRTMQAPLTPERCLQALVEGPLFPFAEPGAAGALPVTWLDWQQRTSCLSEHSQPVGEGEPAASFLWRAPSGKGMTLTAILDFPARFMTQFKVMGLLLIIINTNFITLQLPKKLHAMEGK